MDLFDRQYRFAAGKPGQSGFEVGMSTQYRPALHVSFEINKADAETPNTGKISLWNLNPEHLAILKATDCIVTLRAGYGAHMPLIFAGAITYMETSLDSGDRKTSIEAVDGRIELRDSYVSVSYSGPVSTRKIIEGLADSMGVALSFSYNAEFADLPNGFSFVGPAKAGLDRACASSGLKWQMQNGALQVLMKRDTMTREVCLLSAKSGLVGIPKHIVFGKGSGDEQSGWEVVTLLDGAVGVSDFVRVESKLVQGYFRVRTADYTGDNIDGDWQSTMKLIAV